MLSEEQVRRKLKETQKELKVVEKRFDKYDCIDDMHLRDELEFVIRAYKEVLQEL